MTRELPIKKSVIYANDLCWSSTPNTLHRCDVIRAWRAGMPRDSSVRDFTLLRYKCSPFDILETVHPRTKIPQKVKPNRISSRSAIYDEVLWVWLQVVDVWGTALFFFVFCFYGLPRPLLHVLTWQAACRQNTSVGYIGKFVFGGGGVRRRLFSKRRVGAKGSETRAWLITSVRLIEGSSHLLGGWCRTYIYSHSTKHRGQYKGSRKRIWFITFERCNVRNSYLVGFNEGHQSSYTYVAGPTKKVKVSM